MIIMVIDSLINFYDIINKQWNFKLEVQRLKRFNNCEGHKINYNELVNDNDAS